MVLFTGKSDLLISVVWAMGFSALSGNKWLSHALPQKVDFDRHWSNTAIEKTKWLYCEGSLSNITSPGWGQGVHTHDLDPPSPMHAFARILMTPLPPGLRAHY